LTKIAKRSNREQRHASIIFNCGNPVAWGFNNPREHAEEVAVRHIENYLGNIVFKKPTMVNIRLTRAGKIGLSKPCPACLDLLKEKKFRKVIYSNNKGGFDEIYL